MAEAAFADAPTKADRRLIVPLDVPTVEEARAIVAALGEAVSFYKVGLELLATEGMALARELKGQGKQVFLDWKLHDIGTTVQRAQLSSSSICRLGGISPAAWFRMVS